MKLKWTLWRTNNKLKATQMMLEISTVTQTTLTPTITKSTENPELSTLPVKHVAKRTTPQRHVTLEPMQQTGHFPGRTNIKNRTHTTVYLVVSRLQPNILTRNASFSLRNGDWHDRPETNRRIFHQSHVLSGSNLWIYLWIVQVS